MSNLLAQRLWVAAPWHRTARRYLGAMLVGNLVWEALQLPLYTLWETGTGSYLAFVVLHCSVGDLMIATLTLFVAVILAGRGWPLRNYGRVALLTILFGLTYTVFSEWLNISVRGSWAYAATMPVVPVLGTGLSPILQWIIIPISSLNWARRKTIGD
jgi:hypothetical protein